MKKRTFSRNERVEYVGQISRAFSPSAPINSADLFAGRSRQIDQAINAVFQRGQHVVVFGERGVGKTSLATTLFDFLKHVGFQSLESGAINCDASMDFSALWHMIFREMSVHITKTDVGFIADAQNHRVSLSSALPEKVSPDDVRYILSQLDDSSIIIVDEIDRLNKSDNTSTLLADTIKTLSDHSVDTTIILVGVGDSVDQLIAEHNSIERALIQIQMPRMSQDEIDEILHKAYSQTELTINNNAINFISRLSKGLPHYTHSLGLNSARAAINDHRLNVTKTDVYVAIDEVLSSAQQSINNAYHQAISSTRGNLYPQVLLACALAKADFLGFFSATDVKQPLSEIMGREYDVSAFAQHLKAFCSDNRGGILQRVGTPRRYKFRFVNPLLEPFVIMRGINKNLIDETYLNRL